MKYFPLILVFLYLGLMSCSTQPQVSALKSDKEFFDSQLARLAADLDQLKGIIRQEDEGRLLFLANSTTRAQESIAKLGLGHQQTNAALISLVSKFIYSEMFFEFIRSVENSDKIDEILMISIATNMKSLRVAIGYDDPRTTILGDNLVIMQQGVQGILRHAETPDSVRSALQPILVRTGQLQGEAFGYGDRLIPFLEGVKFTEQVDAIYPYLNELAGTLHLYQLAQEIRGTNEFLKEYLQVTLLKEKQSQKELNVP
jgi:hypothetical protein